MRRIRAFVVRLAAAVTRRRDDNRVREEIEEHLSMVEAEYARSGLPPNEARRRARIEVGSIESHKEALRDRQSLPSIEQFLQDARVALRRMRQAPMFTAAAVATLALGLGVTSAVASLAYSLFYRPLGVEDAEHLVLVEQTRVGRVTAGYPLSMSDYAYYRSQSAVFSELAAHYSTSPMQMVTPAGSLNVNGSVVTASYFDVLRLRPAVGRLFAAADDRVPGRDPVAVLSYDIWTTAFARDLGVIGRVIRINGTPFTVIGVMSEGFRGVLPGLPPNDVWIPSAMFGVGYRYCDAFAHGCNVVGLIGRLAEGFTIGRAQTTMDGLAHQLEIAFPETNRDRGVLLRPARGIRIDDQIAKKPIVRILAGAALVVLLVVSANVAALLLARGLRRRREIAIRLALGASRGRVIRLLLVESVLLACGGAVAGLIVATWAMNLLRPFFVIRSEQNFVLTLDPRVLLAGFVIALITGVCTGLAPALHATRPDPIGAMKDTSAGGGVRRSRWRDALIVVQVAFSVVLLGGSGLLLRSLWTLHQRSNFDPDAIAIVRARPSLVGYSAERGWAYQREVLRRVEAIPGVVAASPANVPPLPGWGRPTQAIRPEDVAPDEAHEMRSATTNVGARYFRTLGLDIVEGREFDDRDGPHSPRVTVINDTLARRLWPTGPVVGRALVAGGVRREVIGVVNDRQMLSRLELPEPIAYFNFWQQDTHDNWSLDSRTHIRFTGDPAIAIQAIKKTMLEVDADVPLSEVSSLGQAIDDHFGDLRAARLSLLVFGVLALVLSTIGLYAALAFAVGQRAREIAVRIALGAGRSTIAAEVFRHGLAVVAIGIGVGASAAAVLAEPVLSHLLYGVSPSDPAALFTGPVVLLVVAIVAIALPARRAMRMNPIAALRME